MALKDQFELVVNMVHYKVSYFPIRGAGEIARQILAYAGQEFEDHRIPKEEWPTVKPSELGNSNLL